LKKDDREYKDDDKTIYGAGFKYNQYDYAIYEKTNSMGVISYPCIIDFLES